MATAAPDRIEGVACVPAVFHRNHDRLPAWCVTLFSMVRVSNRYELTSAPQAEAVVDDFGNLVIVSGWQ